MWCNMAGTLFLVVTSSNPTNNSLVFNLKYLKQFFFFFFYELDLVQFG